MLSKTLSYAINALIHIAKESSESKRITLQEVSDALEVPKPYLGKLIQTLVNHQILQSVKGPKGGFYFRECDLDLKLIVVIEALGDSQKYTKCLLEFTDCNDSNPCPLHENIGQIRVDLLKKFSEISFRDIAKRNV